MARLVRAPDAGKQLHGYDILSRDAAVEWWNMEVEDYLDDRVESPSACDACGRRIGQIHEILDGVCELCRNPGAHDAMLESINEDRVCLAYRERFMCDD